MWRWRARRPHTHGILRNLFKVQGLHSLFCWSNSFRGLIGFKITKVFFSPPFGDPTSLIEEPPNNSHIVAQHILGHPDSVDLDVWGKVLPSLDCVFVEAPSWEMMRGTITAIATLLSRVSFVAHTRYFSSFSLKESFVLHVD